MPVAQIRGVEAQEVHSTRILGISEVRADSDFLMFGHRACDRKEKHQGQPQADGPREKLLVMQVWDGGDIAEFDVLKSSR